MNTQPLINGMEQQAFINVQLMHLRYPLLKD